VARFASAVNLGYLYTAALGVPQSHVAAAHWYRQAAGKPASLRRSSSSPIFISIGEDAQDDTARLRGSSKRRSWHTGGAHHAWLHVRPPARSTPKILHLLSWLSAAALQATARGNATLPCRSQLN